MTAHAIPPTPIDGRWRPVRAELSGEAAPPMALDPMELTFAHGRYEVSYGGAAHDAGSFTIEADFITKNSAPTPSNADSTPHSAPAHPTSSLTLRGLKGNNEGRVIRAIFQHAGDRLRICYGLDGTAPTEFRTAAGDQRYLVFYRRHTTG